MHCWAVPPMTWIFPGEEMPSRLPGGLQMRLHAAFYPLDTERDTGRVIVTNKDGTRTIMDFAAFRGANLESDLKGRDFTLNAIALNLSDNSLHDPLGGAMDLKEKRLRACSPSAFRMIRCASCAGSGWRPISVSTSCRRHVQAMKGAAG